MTSKSATSLTLDERKLAMEIASGSGLVATPATLGDLLAMLVADVTLAAARDQLAVAILERTSARAPGSLRERSAYRDPAQLQGIDAVLAAQGLEINSTFIAEPGQRLGAVRLLIDTAAGLAAQHYTAIGVGGASTRAEHPRERAGQWRLKADLRRNGRNEEIAKRFGAWLANADSALARRIQIEANDFEIIFWAATKAESEAVHRYLDSFARATFLRPSGS